MMAALAAWRILIGYGSVSAGTVGGSASAITLTCSPTVAARAAGQRYVFKLTSAITGATTLAVDGLASGALQWNQAAIIANDFAADDWIMVVDDGTDYQLVTPPKLSRLGSINSLTADGTGATGDYLVTNDASASFAPKKLLISTLQTLLAASAAQQETATSAAVNVTPAVQQRHPSATKASVSFEPRGTNGACTVNASYNVSGVSRTGTGTYVITFTTGFSAAAYAVGHTTVSSGAVNLMVVVTAKATGTCTIHQISASTGAESDLGDEIDLIFTGDQ